MDKIKAFFANDIVKIIAGGLYFTLNGILMTVVPVGPLRDTLMMIWNGIITPLAIFFGIASGGTSNLRNNASVTVTTQLVEKGVVQPKA